MKKLVLMTAIIATAASCSQKPNSKITYPNTQKQDVVDTYFDTQVADPYRWMEDDTTQQVTDWVNAQNKITHAYLSKIPFRDKLKQRMTELVDYEKIGTPFKRHGKYYFYKNDGLQNQSVLYVKETLNGEAKVLLDPNTLSQDGTVALTGISFSKNGQYLAYTISRSGSDWTEIYVLDLQTNTLTNDHIVWAKFTNASWHGNGFYYSAYDAPEDGKAYSNVNENHKIYYHTLGQEQTKDVLVYENKNYPKRFYSVMTDDDETVMFVSESGASAGNRLFMRELNKPNASLIEIASDNNFRYSPLEVIDNYIYFRTNHNAPKYKLMKASISAPTFEKWETLIPENENVLNAINFMGGNMIAQYNQDASDHAYVYDMNGNRKFEVDFPTLGSVGFSGNKDDNEIFYSFTSFTFPTTIYTYNIEKNTSEKYLSPEVKFSPNDFVTQQVFFSSNDGTQIPMFLTFRKGIELNGNNPVYLYGYGGFNVSLNPSFSTARIPFLENGGIYAQVNLRGGGEYGAEWHKAGTKLNKQNVFDDFISAAKFLIDINYTNPSKITIAGGSNGGLLVGACANQRPDLFAVALPAVGVMDMLRYHKFTIGWNWASDYGTSEESQEMFEYLYKYSPINNIKNDGTSYPAILVTTADHDDRVVPAHSFKYAAVLQASNTGKAPKLIRIDTNAGHGAGKPISKIIEEQTDTWAFAMYNMGMNY